MTEVLLRPALLEDVEELVAVEVAAGRLFHRVGLPRVAADVPAPGPLTRAVDERRAWVAVVQAVVVGYAVGSVVDGNAHLDQVSVDPAYSRRGIGRRLVAQVEAWGSGAGLPRTTLTTFRDVPWNAPYYQRLGYRELAPDELGPELLALVQHEAALPGLADAPRCAMVKPA